jgi:hypothetical protein
MSSSVAMIPVRRRSCAASASVSPLAPCHWTCDPFEADRHTEGHKLASTRRHGGVDCDDERPARECFSDGEEPKRRSLSVECDDERPAEDLRAHSETERGRRDAAMSGRQRICMCVLCTSHKPSILQCAVRTAETFTVPPFTSDNLPRTPHPPRTQPCTALTPPPSTTWMFSTRWSLPRRAAWRRARARGGSGRR